MSARQAHQLQRVKDGDWRETRPRGRPRTPSGLFDELFNMVAGSPNDLRRTFSP